LLNGNLLVELVNEVIGKVW